MKQLMLKAGDTGVWTSANRLVRVSWGGIATVCETWMWMQAVWTIEWINQQMCTCAAACCVREITNDVIVMHGWEHLDNQIHQAQKHTPSHHDPETGQTLVCSTKRLHNRNRVGVSCLDSLEVKTRTLAQHPSEFFEERLRITLHRRESVSAWSTDGCCAHNPQVRRPKGTVMPTEG